MCACVRVCLCVCRMCVSLFQDYVSWRLHVVTPGQCFLELQTLAINASLTTVSELQEAFVALFSDIILWFYLPWACNPREGTCVALVSDKL